jgi:soluble lytic murein transglycosylase-like protein
MIASGFSSLKRSVAVSAILCGALAGCASTGQKTSQADLSHANSGIPHPAAVAQAAPADGANGNLVVVYQNQQPANATTSLAKSDRLPSGGATTAMATGPRLPATEASQIQDRMGNPVAQPESNGAQTAIASVTGTPSAGTSASAAYASAGDMPLPSVVAIPTPNPSRPGEAVMAAVPTATFETADNAIPMTPEMVAIQAVIPTPRPGEASRFTATQVAYAAPSPQLAGLTYADDRMHYDFNFDTTGPSIVPAVLEENTEDNVSPEEKMAITRLIDKYAKLYQVPAALIHRVVHRESRYDPKAFNNRGYFGLMQIKYNTAKSMGYEGPASGLFDAETNIKYAAKYLRGAWMVADNKLDNAVALYARGYYYNAKNKGMSDVANGNY